MKREKYAIILPSGKEWARFHDFSGIDGAKAALDSEENRFSTGTRVVRLKDDKTLAEIKINFSNRVNP